VKAVNDLQRSRHLEESKSSHYVSIRWREVADLCQMSNHPGVSAYVEPTHRREQHDSVCRGPSIDAEMKLTKAISESAGGEIESVTRALLQAVDVPYGSTKVEGTSSVCANMHAVLGMSHLEAMVLTSMGAINHGLSCRLHFLLPALEVQCSKEVARCYP